MHLGRAECWYSPAMRSLPLVVGAVLAVGLLAFDGVAHAEIEARAEMVIEEHSGPGDKPACLAAGGTWIPASPASPEYCELDLQSVDDDLRWDWSTFGEASADRAVKAAAAWRAYFEGRARAPKVYAKSFLRTTGVLVTRMDDALARAAKAEAADKASKDPAAAKRRAARARAVAVWTALRADVVALDAAVRKKLPAPPRPTTK